MKEKLFSTFIKKGEILYGESAKDAKNRLDAERKADELAKLIKNDEDNTPGKELRDSIDCDIFTKKKLSSNNGDNDNNPKDDGNYIKNNININFGTLSKRGATASASTNAKLANISALNASASLADASATANARVLNANTLNAHTSTASAHASANANLINAKVGNANAQAASASASVNANAINVSAGNVSATGVEARVNASVNGANIAVGNVSVTGASATANASVNGANLSAFNVSVGGPSAGLSVNVSGPSLSFGNIDIGLTPTLNVGLGIGFDLAIPFLSSGKGGGGNNNANGDKANSDQNAGSNQSNGNKSLNEQLQDKFPNRSYQYNSESGSFDKIVHRNGYNVKFEKNKEKKPLEVEKSNEIDTCNSCETCDQVVQEYEQKCENGMKYAGCRGTASEADAERAKQNNEIYNPPPESEWSGKYTTNDPRVASGYTRDKEGNINPIKNVYLPEKEGDIYYTNTPLSEPEAIQLVKETRIESNGKYVFGGPQGTDPDMKSPEFVTGLKIVDKLEYTQSAHSSECRSNLNSYHAKEMNNLKVVPDYYVSHTDKNFNQQQFDTSTIEGSNMMLNTSKANKAAKGKDEKENDKLLIEELSKKGIDTKKFIKTSQDSTVLVPQISSSINSHDLYSTLRNRFINNRNNNVGYSTSQERLKENKEKNSNSEDDQEEAKPCTDHSSKISCMKCLNGSNDKKIKKIGGNSSKIFGF